MPYRSENVFHHRTGVVAVLAGFSEDGDKWSFEIRLHAPDRRPVAAGFGARELAAWQKAVEAFPIQGPVMPRGWEYVTGRWWQLPSVEMEGPRTVQ